jgi:hypothetical protein
VSGLTFRLLTPAEQAEAEKRCGARPSPRSAARCEEKPRHWETAAPGSMTAEGHAGRTPRGRWKFWPVSVTEKES